MRLGYGFFTKAEKLFDIDEIHETFAKESNFFKEYAETSWLDRYWGMKLMVGKTHIPSITSVLSDTVSGRTNEFKSKTETYGLKSVYAEEWIDYFHEKLKLLPGELEELIKIKYLNKRRGDGKFYEDEVIYTKLNISRSKYYEMKKQALEELGRSLYGGHDKDF